MGNVIIISDENTINISGCYTCCFRDRDMDCLLLDRLMVEDTPPEDCILRKRPQIIRLVLDNQKD